MISISCITKFHSFNLAEQLQRKNLSPTLYTSFSSKKNHFLKHFVGRRDNENVDSRNIKTNIPLAILFKSSKNKLTAIKKFDSWVARQINKSSPKIFIGWSNSSLESIKASKNKNVITILERGSCHILFQTEILEEEYDLYGKKFIRSTETIEREMQEYEMSDYISTPSKFAAGTIQARGISKEKILINPYGSQPKNFQAMMTDFSIEHPLQILYLGNLSIAKGIRYLIEALSLLDFPYKLQCVGSIHPSIEDYLKQCKSEHIHYHGFVNHYKLNAIINTCHVAVQPSIQEGLSMVIPQILSCGLPVIATTNTGGDELIINGENGFIIPIRDSGSIATSLAYYNNKRTLLETIRNTAFKEKKNTRTWDDYGNTYMKNLEKIIT